MVAERSTPPVVDFRVPKDKKMSIPDAIEILYTIEAYQLLGAQTATFVNESYRHIMGSDPSLSIKWHMIKGTLNMGGISEKEEDAPQHPTMSLPKDI